MGKPSIGGTVEVDDVTRLMRRIERALPVVRARLGCSRRGCNRFEHVIGSIRRGADSGVHLSWLSQLRTEPRPEGSDRSMSIYQRTVDSDARNIQTRVVVEV